MKLSIIATAFAATVGLASAAPAIVWKKGGDGGPSSSSASHISDAIDARSLLSSVIDNDDDGEGKDSSSRSSSLAAVIFLVGRDADGSEGLASLALSGKIPQVRDRYLTADEVHHHVRGMESSRTVARDAASAREGDQKGAVRAVVRVSMEEFRRKLASMAQTEAEEFEGGGKDDVAAAQASSSTKVTKSERRRRMAISEADVLVVDVMVDDEASEIDAAIVAAIDSSVVRNVILSSVRSTSEVKHARKLAVGERFARKEASNDVAAAAGRRRLQEEDANGGSSSSTEGVYYVNMTPNIFAGLLFFFLFTFTAHLGLSCMNMIEGQDVYVKKYPHIGREV
ncbi:hypothetical protein ACHAXA_006740 [Cyclostephanos tholiformis]|uniref:Uncharacterized protein n=1 Tax=Cyclostephanos tholiformis TaxID=382380 RepID=A0ABD3SS43_9STRA